MSRTRRRILPFLLAAAAVSTAALPAAAQSPESVVRLRATLQGLGDSARVRLSAPGLLVQDGHFLGLGSDSVLVSEADARFHVGLDEIESLSVEGTRWLGVGAQTGAVAMVVGATAGYFLAYFSCSHDVEDCGSHPKTVGVRFGLVFGTAGAAAGALWGSRMRVWRRVFP